MYMLTNVTLCPGGFVSQSSFSSSLSSSSPTANNSSPLSQTSPSLLKLRLFFGGGQLELRGATPPFPFPFAAPVIGDGNISEVDLPNEEPVFCRYTGSSASSSSSKESSGETSRGVYSRAISRRFR